MLPAIPGLVASLAGAVRSRLRRAFGESADRGALVEALDDPALLVDDDGRLRDCNPRAAAVLGVERSAAVGRPLADLAPALADVGVPDGEGDRPVVELAVDGEPRRFAVEAPVGPGDGTTGRWLVLRDVTEREARDAERERLAALLEGAPVGVVLLDGAGTVVAANERAAGLLATDHAALQGTTLAELQRRGVLGPEFPGHEALVDAPGDPGPRELTVRPPDGDERTLEAEFGARPDGSGAVGVLRDVTGRQRRLDELEHYEAIMEVLPDPVYATDAEGRLTFVNRAFEEQLGYSPEGTEMHFSEFTTPEGTETVLELLREMVGSGGPERATAEIVVVTRDGRQLRVEDSIAMLPGDEAFRGSAGVLRDVTERKRRQEVLTVMNRALRHNLRTNVTSIVGYADLLDREVEGEAETYVARVRESAEWLAKLGDSLRTLQRAIESDISEAVDVETVVEGVVEDAREAHPGADVSVHVATSGALEAGWSLQYALENVVENAVVHSDRDEPTVDVWVADAPRDGWVDIHVEDDGPGIPEAERDVVLGDAAITQLQHGSGIGLWLTRWLVEVFDGEVVIEANEPRGTVVTLRLPRAAE